MPQTFNYRRILTKECKKNNQKCKGWKYVQILAAYKNQAGGKILTAREYQADGKILATRENQADGKILAARENQADGKILAGVEILAPGEIPTSVEILQPAYCLSSGRISNCWLLPGPADEYVSSSLMWWITHVVSKWGVSSSHLAFMGGLSPVLYRLLVPACHAKKWSKSTRQPKIRRPPGFH